MPASNAARRYAQAVFDIGKETGTLAQWDLDLAIIHESLDAPDLLRLLESPETPLDERRNLVNQVFKGVSPLAHNLLDMLLLRQRIALAPQIQEAFDELYLAEQGIAYADVTTAIPLDPQEETRVIESLTRLTGKSIRLRTKVNPDILGGIIAQVGDQLIDGSVASQLRQLKGRLTAAV